MYFWDIKKNTRNMKYVKNLMDVISYGSFCLLSAKISENSYILILCNSIGSPVDNRIINICPDYIGLNETHIIACSKSYVYVWQYRSQHNDLSQNHFGHNINIDLLKKKFMKEIVFFIEDNPNINDSYNAETFNPNKKTSDPISSLFVNSK
jgi:WD repeat-containing protein 35